jgi:hypothetical protein
VLVVANISTHAGYGGGGGATADQIKSYEAVMVPITTSEPTIAYLRRSWGDLRLEPPFYESERCESYGECGGAAADRAIDPRSVHYYRS